MKIIKFFLLLFSICSLTSQDNISDEIKNKFFSKIKTLLRTRSPFNYCNTILNTQNIESKSLTNDRIELDNNKIQEIAKKYSLENEVIEQISAVFYQSQLQKKL